MSPLMYWEEIWKKIKTRKLKRKVAFKDMIVTDYNQYTHARTSYNHS